MQNILRLFSVILYIVIITVACDSQTQYQYVAPSATLRQTDLVGTWQARYGLSIDTITLKDDGTYQQIFEAPSNNYHYESPWNKWYIEYSDSGKPKLHLEGMRYYAYTIELGESGGRLSTGDPVSFYDIDEERTLKMTDKVILRIKGDKNSPRGIVLWHMHLDLDMSPPYFISID